jgi:hypothetical protein
MKKANKNEGESPHGDKLDDCRLSAAFVWNQKRSEVAVALAEGKTQKQVEQELAVPERTQRSWLAHPDFAAEIDRLSLMVGIAGRAERLRLAMRVVRAKTNGDVPVTEKDLLEWLKFAQSETDGVKLDLTKLAAALGSNDPFVADSGSDRAGSEDEAVH